MTHDFFRFPQTPHIAWLGTSMPREDKLLPAAEVRALLADNVAVEEKLDGANLGFSLDEQGQLRAQNRSQYLAEPGVGQFQRLPDWLAVHGDALTRALTPNLIAFGEWCAARHSLDYTALPDWWLLFDVYDRQAGKFWSTRRRDALARELHLATVPRIANGKQTLDELKALVLHASSRYRAGVLEGVVVRREDAYWLLARAKLVHPDFTQAIETHWRNRLLEWNRVDWNRATEDMPPL